MTRAAAAGLPVMAVGRAVLAVTDHLPLALVGRVLGGVGDAPTFLGALRLIAFWFQPRPGRTGTRWASGRMTCRCSPRRGRRL